jgi:hypothetical protein
LTVEPHAQVMPGLVNVGTSLALYEVDSESGSADGAIFPSFSQHVRAAVPLPPSPLDFSPF